MASPGVLRLLFATAAVTALACAQGNSSIFTRATPDSEAALRARITGFFEAQQQGKWRQAEKFVSEDSIDPFLERDHTRYESFEIRDITWGKDYREAKVMMILPYKMDMSAAGVVNMSSVPRPVTHFWRFEENDWYWYVPKTDPCAPVQTPVGEFKPECKDGKPVQDADVANSQKALEQMIASARSQADPAKLATRVTADKKSVSFKAKTSGEGSIAITNNFDGPVTLDLIGVKIPGLTAAFDGASKEMPGRVVVEAKKTAALRLHYVAGDNAPPGLVGMQIRVEPLAISLPVEVTFE